jgi:RNA polymerase sigma factor (sigma-70 family)
VPEPKKQQYSEKSTDLQLWSGIHESDALAWSILVRRYEALVYTIATRAGLSLADASDCFQQTWLLLFRHKRKITQPERLSAWLTTTAKREAIRISQRQSKHVDLDTIPQVADVRPLADEELATLERRARLNSVMNRLDERCRKLLRALFLEPESRSYEAIAEDLGFPKNSMGPVRSRCMAKLKSLVHRVNTVGVVQQALNFGSIRKKK